MSINAQIFNVELDQPSERRGQTRFALIPGIIDADAEEYFGHGNSGMLAGAMRELSGWPIAVIAQGQCHVWVHAGVVTPGNLFLDIYGARPFADAITDYDGDEYLIPDDSESAINGAVWVRGWDKKLAPLGQVLFRRFAEFLITNHGR